MSRAADYATVGAAIGGFATIILGAIALDIFLLCLAFKEAEKGNFLGFACTLFLWHALADALSTPEGGSVFSMVLGFPGAVVGALVGLFVALVHNIIDDCKSNPDNNLPTRPTAGTPTDNGLPGAGPSWTPAYQSGSGHTSIPAGTPDVPNTSNRLAPEF